MLSRFTSVLALSLSLLFLSASANAQSINRSYDSTIQNSVNLYWGGLEDWRYLWAQLKAESGFKENAKSPVGAAGLAQFMPGTWAQVAKTLKYASGSTPYETELAIPAAAYYMRMQRDMWRGHAGTRPEGDRWNLARASYNAGAGHLINAQKLCGGAVRFQEIIACLPQITGPKNSKETIDYNIRIARFYQERVKADLSGAK